MDVAQPLMAGGPVGGNQGGDFVLQPICFSSKDHGADASFDLAPTLRAGGHSDSHANAGVPPAIAYAIQERAVCENPAAGPDGVGVRDDDCAYTMEARTVPQAVAYSVAIRGREGGGTAELGDDLAGCLRASTGGGDKPHVLAPAICVTGSVTHTLKAEGFDASEDGTGRGQPIVPAEAFPGTRNATPDSTGDRIDALTSANDSSGQFPIVQQMAVRRLMPVECERLQGFPDNHTRVPIGKNKDGSVKWAADGPRYKQCGNSMATNVMHWIGSRIAAHLATAVVEPEAEADDALIAWLLAA